MENHGSDCFGILDCQKKNRSSSIFNNIEVIFLISTRARIRLHTKNQLHKLPGSGLKDPMVVGGWLESEYNDHFWLTISLALAKPNKKQNY